MQSLPLPIEYELKMAGLTLIAKDVNTSPMVLKRVPDSAHRTLDVNIALLKISIEFREYEKAADLVKSIQNDLEKTSGRLNDNG